jgi:hypothetical protein
MVGEGWIRIFSSLEIVGMIDRLAAVEAAGAGIEVIESD